MIEELPVNLSFKEAANHLTKQEFSGNLMEGSTIIRTKCWCNCMELTLKLVRGDSELNGNNMLLHRFHEFNLVLISGLAREKINRKVSHSKDNYYRG